jgi:predicted nucleic acid-binding protein
VSRIYLDACSIIYLVEAANQFHQAALNRLLQVQKDPNFRSLTSRLSYLECRIRPIRDRDDKILAAYSSFFSASDLDLIEISSEVIERATILRANHRFKTPDAIHLASAIESKADLFLTGDASLAHCPGLVVEVLGGS